MTCHLADTPEGWSFFRRSASGSPSEIVGESDTSPFDAKPMRLLHPAAGALKKL
jgi:hypothetical protein